MLSHCVSKHVLNVVVRSLSSSTIKILVVFDTAFSRTSTLLSSSALVLTGNTSPSSLLLLPSYSNMANHTIQIVDLFASSYNSMASSPNACIPYCTPSSQLT